MKQFFKSALIITLALVMMVSSLIIVTAEGTSSDDGTTITVSTGGDAPRAYELVWKFKIHNGHLYKRRWNATLGGWYDPAWILVN